MSQVMPAARIRDAYEMLIYQQDKAIGIVLDWQNHHS